MTKRRENHYVPEWYQKGFLIDGKNQLYRLDLSPEQKRLPDGRIISLNDCHTKPTSQCFVQRDLYTTFFGPYIDDEIECRLFGDIDNKGARAVRAYTTTDVSAWHKHFNAFFEYIDAQKIRTPKGLSWINQHYSRLNQNTLMFEMQGIQRMNCTVWTEGVREIVSAEDSDVKFIISDHPVTTYNYALPPEKAECIFPNEPDILLKATQTIFPLDMNNCLILTNLEYAKTPDSCDPLEKRSYAKHFRNTMARTDQLITGRKLNAQQVVTINRILKSRAHKHIAAPEKSWLYPEKEVKGNWSSFSDVLLPSKDDLLFFGGETYIGYEDGSSGYQDAFGRPNPENEYLRKPQTTNKLKPKDSCGCGSGKQFRNCCKGKNDNQRPSWKVLSIRERNLALCRGVRDILGFNDRKDWNDVRRELSPEQVIKIHELYSFFWPAETDLLELLPKPDKTLRAIYTGIVDPRVISQNAVSLTLYFDEILIHSPFMNPNSVSEKFNPIKNPHHYLHETLKNSLLLLELEPFIESGFINLIPDLCNFDIHLHKQMLNMAEQRSKLLPLEDEDFFLMKKLQEQDFKRSVLQMPKEAQKAHIKKIQPDMSEEEIKNFLQYSEYMLAKDPLALHPDNKAKNGTKNGSMMMYNLSPNFEISLFLAQVTGSILLTDNQYRWKEILSTQVQNFFQTQSQWAELLEQVREIKFPVHSHIFKTFDLRLQGKSERMRLALKNLCRIIKSPITKSNKEAVNKKILKQLQSAEAIAFKDIQTPSLNPDFDKLIDITMKSQCSLSFFAPQGGIQHHNTQRLLISYGGKEHLDNVPIAVYVNHEWTYEELL